MSAIIFQMTKIFMDNIGCLFSSLLQLKHCNATSGRGKQALIKYSHEYVTFSNNSTFILYLLTVNLPS